MVTYSPRISVVVPTRGRAAMAAGCVRAILAQEGAPAFELILADQSEDEATFRAASEAAGPDPRLRILRLAGRGRSKALNAGCRAAAASWIAVTDDDCRPASDWLVRLGAAIDAAPVLSVVVGRVVAGPRLPGKGEPPAILDEPAPRAIRGRVDRDWIHPNLAFPRSALEAVGGFDERLSIGTPIPGGEDNDWGYRLLDAGWTILYRPEPSVVHEAWRSTEERLALKHAYGLGQGGFYAKHLARADLFIGYRVLSDLLRQARGAAAGLLRGSGDDARGPLAYVGGMVEGVAKMGALLVRGVGPGGGR